MDEIGIILRNGGYLIEKKSLLTCLLFFWFLSSNCQEERVDHQLWFDVIPHFEINNRFEYYGDMSYRTSTSGEKFRRFVVRPSVKYHWTHRVDLIGGVGLFLTWEEVDYNTVELRLFQEVRLKWPKIWRMNFKHRGLIEERLLWNNEGDFDPNLRLRYRIKTKLPLNKPSIDYKAVYIPASYEVFGNIGPKTVEQFQNRARAMVGLGYVFSDKWISEFEVIFQRSRSTQTDDLKLSDRIFRFKLIYDGWIFGE